MACVASAGSGTVGLGIAGYARYAPILDADGEPLSVREALALINQTLDELLAELERESVADSRWALAWFEQRGSADGDYVNAACTTMPVLVMGWFAPAQPRRPVR